VTNKASTIIKIDSQVDVTGKMMTVGPAVVTNVKGRAIGECIYARYMRSQYMRN
jgi:hypothetical protein